MRGSGSNAVSWARQKAAKSFRTTFTASLSGLNTCLYACWRRLKKFLVFSQTSEIAIYIISPLSYGGLCFLHCCGGRCRLNHLLSFHLLLTLFSHFSNDTRISHPSHRNTL